MARAKKKVQEMENEKESIVNLDEIKEELTSYIDDKIKKEFTDEIEFTTDSDSVKNCFRLEGGDDLFTATIRNCNPNGSSYIWYITDSMKNDMSPALVSRLESYSNLMNFYTKTYVPEFNQEIVQRYNTVATKYKEYNPAIELIDTDNIIPDSLSWAWKDAKWYAEKYYSGKVEWYVDKAKQWLSWASETLKGFYNDWVDNLNEMISDKVNWAISWELNKFKIK